MSIRKAKTPRQMAQKTLTGVQDFKRVFATEQGKRVLYDLMNKFDMLRSTRDKTTQDVYEREFREGGRNVILYILTMMKTDTKQLENYIEEADRHATE